MNSLANPTGKIDIDRIGNLPHTCDIVMIFLT